MEPAVDVIGFIAHRLAHPYPGWTVMHFLGTPASSSPWCVKKPVWLRLSAIQCLDLGSLINRQHHGIVWRAQVVPGWLKPLMPKPR